MKVLITLPIFLITSMAVQAQVINPKQTAKQKAEQRTNSKADQTIDKGFDKIEEGIDGLFKKKNKKNKQTLPPTDTAQTNTTNEMGGGNEMTLPNQPSSTTKPSTTTKTNTKFDFERGTKVLQYDDFARLSIGDFPAEYNSNTTGEIITLSDKDGKWLNLTKNGCIVPDYMKKLPDNFTLEFEVGINTDPTNNYSGFGLNFTVVKENLLKEMFFDKGNAVVYLHPGAAEASVWVNPLGDGELENRIKMPEWNANEEVNRKFAKISVWRQKGRLRVYVDESKVVDIPRFFVETKPYSFAFFRSFFGDCEIYLSKIRYAIAGEDLRAKLMSEGKFSTTGITFDVNSDKIKAESKVALDEIAALLTSNTDIKLKIVGHTDSDGDAKANLLLSEKRAVAIKNALVSNYGIGASRLLTEGKGEAAPLNNNATAQDKAANRRAEFIKL